MISKGKFIDEMEDCVTSLEREIKESPDKEWSKVELMKSIESIDETDIFKWYILSETLFNRHRAESLGSDKYLFRSAPGMRGSGFPRTSRNPK